MSIFHLVCLLFGLIVHVADGKRRRRTLSGESGNLQPDEDDDDSHVYNTEKLIIFFDDDCVTSEDEATDTFTSLISEYGDCLYGNSTVGLFEDPISGSWHGYVDVYFDNIDCLSDISMDYDDYCIESFNYEEILNLDGGCRSDASYIYLHNERTNLWHLDQIDGTKNSYYNYYSYDDNSGIDIYILDTGIRTTHQEFDGINVGNHDWGYDNDEVDQSHGTHVAGIAAGKKVGVHRGAKNIYSFAVCRSAGWGCFEQDIEAGLKMVDRALEKRPTKYRRAVINMSWGGKSDSDRGHLNSYIQSIYNSGGIMVAAAGNSAEDACSHWPSGLRDWVIAVGAYNANYEVAWFSNYGSCVDIYAPGQDVLSSIIDCNHCYAFYNGTSMASPAMAGMIANWLSMDQELTFSEIKSKIATTSYSKTLSQCPSGTCRGIEMSCNEYYSFYDSSNDISSTSTPNSCNTESYSCAVLSNVPETLGVDINGIYTNTGQCYNSRPVYKATNIEDIGDLYLFYDGSWFVNYILCKSNEDDCKVYLYGRNSFDSTSNGANYYSYQDYTFSDDKWTVHYTSSISLTGSDSSSTCYVSSSRSSNADTDTITSDDSDDDVVYGVEGESVSFAAISEDSTDDGSNRSSTDDDNDDSDEWWPWVIVALFGVSLIVLVGVIIYYQRKIKALQNQPNDGANYHLMAGK